MRTVTDYKKELIGLTKDLPNNKVRELLDFAQFLKAKSTGFSYVELSDSVEYVRKLRTKEGKRLKSSNQFIEDLIEWQRSNS